MLGHDGSLMHHDSGTIRRTGRHGDFEASNRLTRPRGCGACTSIAVTASCTATAYPSSGGFDEAAPLIFLHAEDGSGADFRPLARRCFGTDRSIYVRRTCRAAARPTRRKAAWRSPASRSPSWISSVTCACAASTSSAAGAAQLSVELAATRPQEVRRLIVAGTQQPRNAASPSRCSSSRPIRGAFLEPADTVVAEIRSFLDRV